MLGLDPSNVRKCLGWPDDLGPSMGKRRATSGNQEGFQYYSAARTEPEALPLECKGRAFAPHIWPEPMPGHSRRFPNLTRRNPEPLHALYSMHEIY